MANIARLYEFINGQKAFAPQVNAELDQIIATINGSDTTLTGLSSIVDGNSGADKIGATAIKALGAATVQGILEEINIDLSTHKSNVANPHQVTNTQVGLGNVTNNLQATKSEFDGHTGATNNPHSVTKTQVGLANVDNTSDANKPVSTAQATAIGLKVDKVAGKSLILDTEITRLAGIATGAEVNVQSDWNSTSGDAFIKNKPTLGTAAQYSVGTSEYAIPILDGAGKLDFSVIPASAISETSVVATQVAMLALSAGIGDVAVRTDLNKTYILKATPASTLSNWQELLTPTDAIQSVNGKTGTVTLNADDVGALDTDDIINNLTSDATADALSAAQGKALATLIGTLANLNAFITEGARANLVAAINAVIARVGTGDFNAYFGSIVDLVSAVNYVGTHKVECSTMVYLRLNEGKIEASSNNTDWIDATGEQGIQGKGYNPRGNWVSEGEYVNNTTTIDVVIHDGGSYYCKTSVTGTDNPSIDTTHWGVLAYSGATAIASSILMTGYSKAASPATVAGTDSVSVAIGKLEKNDDGKVDKVTDKSLVLDTEITKLATVEESAVNIPLVIGTQNVTTASWTGVASTLTALTHGTTIRYWLPRTSASNVTLNLTLKGGSTTGAINCYFTGTTRVGTQYAAGSLVTMIYLENALITGTPYTGWFVSSYINTVYTHPTTAGNKHIPTGGTVGQIMTNSASGTAVWANESVTPVVDNLTSTDTDKALSAKQGKVLNEKIDERTQESCIVTLSTDDAQSVVGQKITLTNVTAATTEEYTLATGENSHTFKIAQNQIYKIKVNAKVGDYTTPSETSEFTAIASNIRNVAMIYEKIYRYGFKREKTEANPSTRITYLYDAVGKTPAYMDFATGEFNFGSWKNFTEEVSRPVMLKTNKTVDYELSRSDMTKKADGVTASDISNTSYDGNAMIEFRKWKWVYRYEDSTHEYVIFSNGKYSVDYEAYAHENELGSVNNAFYWGAFKGSNVSSKLRSLAGQTIMVNQTRNTEVSYATANGSGHYTIYKSGWDYICDLLTLISKSDNGQASFGQGRHGASNALATGTLKDKPMFMGYDNATSDVKVFGIEGFWGNVWEGVAGLVFNGKIKTKMTPPYNFDGTGYLDTGVIPNGTTGGYVSVASVTGESGYVPKTASGSATQYYCDGLWFNNSIVGYALVGGNWNNGFLAGPRYVALDILASGASAGFGSRLSFLDPA